MAARKTSIDLERRVAPREKLDPIQIRGFTSLDHRTLLTRYGEIVDASKTGFMMLIERKNIVPTEFRENLSLQELEGDRVILTIDPLDLEISGTIARTKRVSKDLYEICIDFSDDAPEYWRECLFDMLRALQTIEIEPVTGRPLRAAGNRESSFR